MKLTHYLVTHSSQTPFNLSKNNNVLAVELQVTLGKRRFAIDQIGFLASDPRICFIPLPRQYVEASGLETFELALQPERWEEAILVKNDESNFGRTEFRRLTSSAQFLKMDRLAFGELFAEFASGKGDLAFTKNARFIGVMSDSKHALVIDAFLASGVLKLSNNYQLTQPRAPSAASKTDCASCPTKFAETGCNFLESAHDIMDEHAENGTKHQPNTSHENHNTPDHQPCSTLDSGICRSRKQHHGGPRTSETMWRRLQGR